MKINTVYTSYNGEVNSYGIGSPTIVLRTQGCHIRCYASTMGILCDTPEALQLQSDKPDVPVSEIIKHLKVIREKTGINLIMLTGGDPLARKTGELHELFAALGEASFKTTVETSGTLDPTAYFKYPNVSFILDRKLRSAGVRGNLVEKIAMQLRSHDFIKFVVADDDDYAEMKGSLSHLVGTEAKIAVGPFWGGQMTVTELMQRLGGDKLLGRVVINFQSHKLITLMESTPLEQVHKLQIPQEI